MAQRNKGGAMQMRWLLALLLAIVHQGEGLKCWTCMSDVVAACNDPLEVQDLPGPIECAGPPPADLLKSSARPVCYKAVVKLNEVETHVYRGCDWASALGAQGAAQAQFCAHAPGLLRTHAQVLSCTTCLADGCNGASGASATQRHSPRLTPLVALALAAAAACLRA